MILETKYEAIELQGGTLAISAYDQNDTELFRWENDAELCKPFLDLMPLDYLLRTDEELRVFIDGHEDEIIAWAWQECRREERTELKRA